MELYGLDLITAEKVFKEMICFKMRLKKDEAIRFNRVVGLDQQSSACLQMFLLKISSRIQAKVELRCRTLKDDLHFGDHGSSINHAQNKSGSLDDTFDPNNQSFASSVRSKVIDSMYNDDDDIAIPYWLHLEKKRTVEEGPAQHTKRSDDLQPWIKQVQQKRKNQQRIR